MSKATDILLSLKAPATLDSEQVTELKQSWLSAQGVAREATDENYKLRLNLADANRKLNSLANHNALQQPEITRLRAELAKANERVKELEAKENLTMLTTHEATLNSEYGKKLLNKFAIEKKIEALNQIKDKWIKKASEIPVGLECRSKGSSCYNWAMFYAKELTDEAEQLRKEQE